MATVQGRVVDATALQPPVPNPHHRQAAALGLAPTALGLPQIALGLAAAAL